MKKKDIMLGLLTALFLAIIISPFASPWPDGLEKVAQDKGFLEKVEIGAIIHSPIPDYVWPGIRNERISVSVSGIAGTVLVFVCALGIGFFLCAIRSMPYAKKNRQLKGGILK